MNKTFGMIGLGCDKNRVDGERLLGEIRRHGCEITDDIERAQVLVVNTCAFLNASRKEAIDAVIEGNAYRSGALEKIVVAGCLPEKYIAELYPALTEADVFLGVSDATALFPALERAYAGERVNAVHTGREGCMRVISTPSHIKYLKIADGCSNHCTYCLIPKIRGAYRSYPMEQLVEEARSLGETEELVLVAQDTTRYGEDVGANQFIELLKKISELDNIRHIRLLYCYPEVVSEALIEEVRANPKILKYLDIPLQHSEDEVLKRMGRRGSRASYLQLIARLRERIPEIALRTTFIAGFPGETEAQHEGLLAFLEEARFENCGFFAYSREPDTPAYRLKEQIPARVKERRVRALYRAQRAVSAQILSAYRGKTIPVVTDSFDAESGMYLGRAAFQAYEIDGVVRFTAPHAAAGRICRVCVERTDAYDLYGTSKGDILR